MFPTEPYMTYIDEYILVLIILNTTLIIQYTCTVPIITSMRHYQSLLVIVGIQKNGLVKVSKEIV